MSAPASEAKAERNPDVLPRIEPIVDAYRLRRLSCPACRATTCGALPAGVSAGGFGPYLQAVLAMFAGAYRLGLPGAFQLHLLPPEMVGAQRRISSYPP